MPCKALVIFLCSVSFLESLAKRIAKFEIMAIVESCHPKRMILNQRIRHIAETCYYMTLCFCVTLQFYYFIIAQQQWQFFRWCEFGYYINILHLYVVLFPNNANLCKLFNLSDFFWICTDDGLDVWLHKYLWILKPMEKQAVCKVKSILRHCNILNFIQFW